MTGQRGPEPPIGGADLECLLACQDLRASMLPVLLSICEEHGFQMVETDPLLAYGIDPVEPEQISQALHLSKFVAGAERRNSRRCIVNLCGILIDTRTSSSMLLDFEHRVLTLSIPEDVLWGFGEDTSRADFEKLRLFAMCCEEIASELSPGFGYLGTEELHPEDIVVGAAEGRGVSHVDEAFFSESRLKELFDWYLNVYTRRWEKT